MKISSLLFFLLFLSACENEPEKKKLATKIIKTVQKKPSKAGFFWTDTILLYPKKSTIQPSFEYLNVRIEKLKPLHQKMGKPKSNDWLARHQEKGQTFSEYFHQNPVKAGLGRNKIYLLPLGAFDESEKKLIFSVAEYLRLYFELSVVIKAPQSDSIIPDSARRNDSVDYPEDEQLLTKYILYKTLLPQLPQDAVAYMALTNKDLYPNPKWNFVFGQASTQDRVGVSSFFRLKEEGENGLQKTLRRIVATSSHEIGHMLSILHCKAFECVMNGSNSLIESDSRPIYPCPECVAKLSWNIGFDLKSHFINLKTFFAKYGLVEEQKYYEQAINRLN